MKLLFNILLDRKKILFMDATEPIFENFTVIC